MSDNIILPSIGSLALSSSQDSGFGYNPAVGANSNAISEETSALLLSKKTINVSILSSSTIYERNISKKGTEINLSSLSFLFCEIVSWAQSKSKGIQDLEARLNGLGYQIGQKYLELTKLREGLKYGKRETKIIDILQFIHGPIWKTIFGKIANELEKSQDLENEYMIIDNIPLVSKFISVPKDYGNLNVSAFVAGIIEGALDSAYFPAEVSAHSVPKEGFPLRTVFLIKFDQSVLDRDEIRR
ncbi:trafficking protein particle complex subunit 31 [[Candida] anglica]|uniref:Trafficking protein particle complex subunit n=1 Tax=[Candida] anglica TaxID=148631 RepID=A0ABP0EB71_9ASCO